MKHNESTCRLHLLDMINFEAKSYSGYRDFKVVIDKFSIYGWRITLENKISLIITNEISKFFSQT